jgi:ABC-2 type transport system ATP-binding protein
MNTQYNEIHEYLNHGEHGLAARRLLDAAYDTNNISTLQQAISISRKLSSKQPAGFIQEAKEFLQNLISIAQPGADKRFLVEAKQISKVYRGGNFSLKPMDMKLATGEVIGIVGENGNGKTTLLRTLAGQLALSTGDIQYGEISKKNNYAIKNYIAFVPQRIPRWYGYLKDNLHFSAAISGYTGLANDVMIDYVLERFGLTPYAHLTWNQISSGYRTRFEIARIMLQKPSLLILDEPLANLDINAQQTLLTDLKLITKSKRHNMGIILSSQQLHEVEKVADDVLMLGHGALMYVRSDIDAAVGSTSVLELETKNSRQQIEAALGGKAKVSYTGGYFMIESTENTIPQLILTLASKGIEISYLRDISNSTKQLFNKL